MHEGLVGIFVNWAHEHPVVRLQIIASRWQPEWPTYQVVRDAANRLFLPVIREYNRRNGTRYRVKIEAHVDTLPKLSPAGQKAFNEFANGANLQCLHPFDWQRFYRFVRVCYATKNDPYESDVAYFLRNAGSERIREFHRAGLHALPRLLYSVGLAEKTRLEETESATGI